MSQTPSSNVPVGGAPAEPVAASDGGGDGSTQAPRGGTGSQLPATGPIVLDASFVIALLRRDPGANALAHVLPRGVMTSVTAGEVFTAIAEAGGPDPQRVEGVLRALGVSIVDLPLAATHQFPRLRHLDTARRVRRRASGEKAPPLSLADFCVLGYALSVKLPILVDDQHWDPWATQHLGILTYSCSGHQGDVLHAMELRYSAK